jgi:predicted DsbA family dithiol-disulfide isomerase
VRVEIWSDVVCPWCYIGKRKFEAALRRVEADEPIEIIWRAYQLDPTAPRGKGRPVAEVYTQKFGGVREAAAVMGKVTTIAAGVGLDFHLDTAIRANTFDAHRLLTRALATGGSELQGELKERLLQAYFTESLDIGNLDTLATLAADVGFDHEQVVAFLASDAGRDDVEADIEAALDNDITGVPHFVFDGRWSIPGAQDPDLFLRALDKMLAIKATEAEAALAEAAADAAIPQIGAASPLASADGATCDPSDPTAC